MRPGYPMRTSRWYFRSFRPNYCALQIVRSNPGITRTITMKNASNEPRHDKTNKIGVPSEDSDQPGHLPSLIRAFAVRMKKAWVLSYPLSTQRRLWSGWADAQADLSLRWAHSHFVGFVMSRLKCYFCNTINIINVNIYQFLPWNKRRMHKLHPCTDARKLRVGQDVSCQTTSKRIFANFKVWH